MCRLFQKAKTNRSWDVKIYFILRAIKTKSIIYNEMFGNQLSKCLGFFTDLLSKNSLWGNIFASFVKSGWFSSLQWCYLLFGHQVTGVSWMWGLFAAAARWHYEKCCSIRSQLSKKTSTCYMTQRTCRSNRILKTVLLSTAVLNTQQQYSHWCSHFLKPFRGGYLTGYTPTGRGEVSASTCAVWDQNFKVNFLLPLMTITIQASVHMLMHSLNLVQATLLAHTMAPMRLCRGVWFGPVHSLT